MKGVRQLRISRLSQQNPVKKKKGNGPVQQRQSGQPRVESGHVLFPAVLGG